MSEAGIPWPSAESPEDAHGWVKVDHPLRYDVVVFSEAGRPAHVGVCLGAGRFLHVDEDGPSRIDSLSSRLYRSRIYGFYRYTGERNATNDSTA